jgi:hypothetical protein
MDGEVVDRDMFFNIQSSGDVTTATEWRRTREVERFLLRRRLLRRAESRERQLRGGREAAAVISTPTALGTLAGGFAATGSRSCAARALRRVAKHRDVST